MVNLTTCVERGILPPDHDRRLTSNLEIVILLCSILCSIAVFTIVANVIIIIAIARSCRKRCCRAVAPRVRKGISKTLMASMAVCDTFVGCFIMPMSIYEQVSGGKWSLGFTLCDLRHLCDVYFCTVSVYHVVCMAIDRYMAVCQPMFYRTLTCRTGYLLVFVSWTVPTMLTFLPYLNGWHLIGMEEVANCLRLDDVCANIFSNTFQIIAVVLSLYLPIALVFFLYLIILHKITRVNKRFQIWKGRRLRVFTSRWSHQMVKVTSTPLRKSNLTSNVSEPVVIPQDPAADSASPSLVISNVIQETPNASQIPVISSVIEEDPHILQSSLISSNILDNPDESSAPQKRCYLGPSPVLRAPKNKALKTIGSIVICFTLCWLPFGISTTITTYYRYTLPSKVFLTVLWLGYINSALNPLLYCSNASIKAAVKDFLLILLRSVSLA